MKARCIDNICPRAFTLNFALSHILLMLVITGCGGTYQYITMSSSLKANEQHEFVNENDTARIKYTFQGENCPVSIEIYNKLEKPIYIDWKESAVVLDGKKLSYWIDQSSITGTTSGSSIHWNYAPISASSTNSGTIQGTLTRPDQISFIPPHSYIRESRINLNNKFLELISYKQKETLTIEDNVELIIWRFTKENTPFQFRSFLTFSTDKEFVSTSHLDDTFWTSEITQTTAKPSYFSIDNFPNRYFIRK